MLRVAVAWRVIASRVMLTAPKTAELKNAVAFYKFFFKRAAVRFVAKYRQNEAN